MATFLWQPITKPWGISEVKLAVNEIITWLNTFYPLPMLLLIIAFLLDSCCLGSTELKFSTRGPPPSEIPLFVFRLQISIFWQEALGTLKNPVGLLFEGAFLHVTLKSTFSLFNRSIDIPPPHGESINLFTQQRTPTGIQPSANFDTSFSWPSGLITCVVFFQVSLNIAKPRQSCPCFYLVPREAT